MPKETVEHTVGPAPSAGAAVACVFLGGDSYVIGIGDTGAVRVGRDPSCELFLDTSSVSRLHARLDVRGDRVQVVDLDSKNGTLVDGRRLVANAPEALTLGQEITLGEARIVVLRERGLPSGATPAWMSEPFGQRVEALLRQGPVTVARAQIRARELGSSAGRALVGKLPAGALVGVDGTDTILVAAPGQLAFGPTFAPVRIVAETTARDGSTFAEITRALGETSLVRARRHEMPVVAHPTMRELYRELGRVGQSAVSVLVIGETGVGKEVVAAAIHTASGRKGRLVAINAAALPENLVEAELFGHERGAFSGATHAKVGLIEAADKGTLFLDEIGELSPSLQSKLLRVLETKRVLRLGSTEERAIDVRFVAATNRDLVESVRARTFREDLYYRLNACVLHIPPLRERASEVQVLALHFAAELAESAGKPPPAFHPRAIAALERHAWPGNVRELKNAVERALALASDGVVLASHLPAAVQSGLGASPQAERHGPDSIDVRGELRETERQRILDALAQAGGNQTKAAELLGLPRRTLAYKMMRLGIRATR